jgi:cytochrome P450
MAYQFAAKANFDGAWSWTLLHLIRNPQHLASFHDEIARNPPVNQGIYGPLDNMPFSEACLRETGRLYANMMTLRYVSRDLHAPDGTVVRTGWAAVLPMAVHRDPKTYENPDKWDPLRHLPSADGTPSDCALRSRNLEFLMWGTGRNVCAGERLSHSLLRSALWPSLLDNYSLEVLDGIIEGEGVDGVGVAPDHGKSLGTPYAGTREIYVKVTKRAVPWSG